MKSMAKKRQKPSNVLTDPMTQLFDEDNLHKYKKAGAITAKALDKLVKMCKVGQRVFDICAFGDKYILEQVGSNGEDGGIAFPTSVSINNLAGCFSPLPTDQTVISDGDLVKIELGVHVDGFPALIAYTVVVSETGEKIEGPRANVVRAVAGASKEILKVMRPGKSNFDVVKVLNKYAEKYNCSLPYITDDGHAPGVLSFQMSRYVIDGYNDDDDEFVHRFILSRQHEDYEFSMVDMELEEDEVYCVDIVFSTGTGRLRHADKEITIYKRLPDVRSMLKLKASRATLSSFGDRFPVNIKDRNNTRFKLGLKECLSKNLITDYPVLEEKGEYIARIKFTVIVKDKPILITGRSADEQVNKVK